MKEFSFPIMIFHGKLDSICSYKESKKFIECKMGEHRKLHLFEYGYHELQHDEEKDELLKLALNYLEELPKSLKVPFGRIVESELRFRPKPKRHTIKYGTRIVILLGILFFIYRRFFKK